MLLLFASSTAWGGDLIGPGEDDFDREVGTLDSGGRSLDFELFRPPEHESSNELPLTVFLHGITDGFSFKQARLNDTMRGLVHATQRDNVTAGGCDVLGQPACAPFDEAYASYLLVPKIRDGNSWSGYHSQLGDLVGEIANKYQVDQNRIYLLGYSDGGFATVDLLDYRSNLFAAGVPISGGGSATNSTVTSLTQTPTWFFHGKLDPIIPPESSVELATLVQAAGGEARVSVVPGGHNAGYAAAFAGSNNELFPWLFEQERSPSGDGPIPPIASYLVQDLAVDGITDDEGDEISNLVFERNVFVGERDSTNDNYVGRLFTKFDLPVDADDGESLEQATLRLYFHTALGSPNGPLSIFHSIGNDRLGGSTTNYDDENYADTGIDLLQPEAEGRQYYEVDVTEFIRLDYQQDEDPGSAFRFQVDDAMFFENSTSGAYRIETSGARRPELELTFVKDLCNPNTGGDLDGNGTVEFADFLLLSANFGVAVDGPSHELGDIDCSGTVEFADFLALSSNFGSEVEGASVPEPNGLTLIGLAWIWCGMLRRSRSQ